MQWLLGDPNFTWAKHIDKVVIVVVFLSILPMLWKGMKHWLAKRRLAKLVTPTLPTNSAATPQATPSEPKEPVPDAPVSSSQPR
jgi:membrane-associated protein